MESKITIDKKSRIKNLLALLKNCKSTHVTISVPVLSDIISELYRRRQKMSKVKHGTRIEPCYKFISYTPEEQIVKLEEEFNEVKEALADYRKNPTKETREHLLSELYDVEITAETMTRQVAENRLEREAALKVTIVKNKVRGYYKK
ncbi:hypothetical protein M3079_02520 [Phascolarctobacterium sp. ET69]|uniref:hypothetical protein n=1 Tax=Phascolarctobacterium sp. ET69 TaxID=2939420 RepID=UPI002012EFDF|nr:hypothetical protein [Phascolarctobacterium sp. ET69]MCL1604859.1 hypothetical protein [Phascolarctobacterium sp. ET69]